MLLGAALCARALLVPRARAERAARRADAHRGRAARRVHGALDPVVARAVGLLDRGEPDVLLPRGVRRDDGARPARARALGGGAARDRDRLRRRLRLGAADQGVPGRAGGGRDLRAAARAVRLLERGRADGRDSASCRCCGSARGAPGRGVVERARLARHRAARGRADAVVLARRAARARARARVLVRGRAAAPARRDRAARRDGGRRAGDRVGVRHDRAQRPTTCRCRCAPTPATSSARCCC